jgi:hypothetical protein
VGKEEYSYTTLVGGVMKKFLWAVLALVLVFSSACRSGGGTGPEDNTPGTYNLQTVDGKTLPFTLEEESGFKAEVVSISYRLERGGVFSSKEVFRYTEEGKVRTEEELNDGNWVLQSGSINFTTKGGDQFTGQLKDGVITIKIEGYTLVFRKQ